MQTPPHVARVLHLREVVKQRGKTPLANGKGLDLGGHGRLRGLGRRIDSENLPPVTCHMSSEPWDIPVSGLTDRQPASTLQRS
jgi:hypothetical protein